MPHKSIAAEVAALNKKYRHHSATEVLQLALKELAPRKIAMVSSFGAESVALLHLLAISDNTVPVLFINTRLLFAETLVYQADVSEKLGLKDIRILQPSRQSITREDPYDALRFTNPDRCCDLRKTQVLHLHHLSQVHHLRKQGCLRLIMPILSQIGILARSFQNRSNLFGSGWRVNPC